MEDFRSSPAPPGSDTALRTSLQGTNSQLASTKNQQTYQLPAAVALSTSPEKYQTPPILGTVPRSRPVKSVGSGVKAMAALFENASKTSTLLPSPGGKMSTQADSKPSEMLSPYTINVSSVKSAHGSGKRNIIASPAGVQATESVQPPVGTRVLKQPCTPEPPSSDPGPAESHFAKETGGENVAKRAANVLTSPPTSPQQGPITPQRTSSTRWSTRSAYASKETPSTTHRFPLLSTPEQNQQQTTPILDSSGPTANTDANPATESSRDEEANLSLRPQLQPRKPVEDEHREETSHFDHADVDKSNRNTVDTELARLRRQLRQAEQACAMWRERAERAELRVRALERGGC
ncbi:uncharacterized protein THITE_154264 [Thermothielavioides terrestris NRRL 8126]|uniref:Uncharacterized protein n=1 Tax=Thermothielavioides terrestris (strain ATCC 38088 / NRRL 8126) TaxID=578455 RepID=G2QTS1_THETT|nr:uncharacterized protein THITE_154264 [Thermothielavioides terrestris NRRL 8126]AEO62781.1 hypothetical protein THITE_154264 [Thermothielavioides terrestris NRRL 8126]